MSSDLTWSYHVDLKVNKAIRVLGLFKRTVGCNYIVILSILYTSLLRLILEYACPVWAPCLVKDILSIEKIQRRASRIALGQKPREMPYEERCKISKAHLHYRKTWSGLVKKTVRIHEVCKEMLEFLQGHRRLCRHNFGIELVTPMFNNFSY